jgi:hypothetical protein
MTGQPKRRRQPRRQPPRHTRHARRAAPKRTDRDRRDDARRDLDPAASDIEPAGYDIAELGPVSHLALTDLTDVGDYDGHGGSLVPITVWRVAGIDQPARHATYADGDGLTPRLAALLVGAYTRLGDTILDLSRDPSIAGAAGAGARRYLPLTDPTALAHTPRPRHGAALIVLRWPSPDTDTDRRDSDNSPDAESDIGSEPDTAARPVGVGAVLAAVFAVCRTVQAADGHTVVVLAVPPTGPPYIEYAEQLILAARYTGLGYVQHIVAVTVAGSARHPGRMLPPDVAGQVALVLTSPSRRVTVFTAMQPAAGPGCRLGTNSRSGGAPERCVNPAQSPPRPRWNGLTRPKSSSPRPNMPGCSTGNTLSRSPRPSSETAAPSGPRRSTLRIASTRTWTCSCSNYAATDMANQPCRSRVSSAFDDRTSVRTTMVAADGSRLARPVARCRAIARRGALFVDLATAHPARGNGRPRPRVPRGPGGSR